MPSAVPIFLKMADEKQVIYFTWPYLSFVLKYILKGRGVARYFKIVSTPRNWRPTSTTSENTKFIPIFLNVLQCKLANLGFSTTDFEPIPHSPVRVVRSATCFMSWINSSLRTTDINALSEFMIVSRSSKI